MATVGTPEFNEGVRRLAQYRPFEKGGEGLTAVIRDLTQAAAEINGGGFKDLAECRQAFIELWDLEVEIEELNQARTALITEGRASKVGGGFRLTEEARVELAERAQQVHAAEELALEQWEAEARSLRPDLSSDDLTCLRQDLEEWLGKIVARHGAEAALVLYPEDERAHRMFEHIERLGTGFLPKHSEAVMEVREEALKGFVRQPTAEQRTFLANRLNTAFYLTVLTLDPAAEQLVQARAKNVRIYIDTNVLYAILGMAPADEVLAANRLLDLSKGLGYQLAVTPWTVKELSTSIERARKNVQIHGTTFNPGLARLMVQVTGEKGATRSYWNQFLKNSMTAKDFFDRAAAFEEDLPSLGIDVVTEGCAKVEDQTELVLDYASLFERILGVGRRDRKVIEHDAKHRLLVERLRPDGTRRFSSATSWFLTQDTQLPTFAAMMPEADQEPSPLPFCISPSAWVQVVRAMTPRTDDFEHMVVELLASPFVGYRGPVDQRAVKEVVARMDQYEDDSAELAMSVVQDTALMRDIAAADPEQVEKRVHDAYGAKAKELQAQAAESARIATEAEKREKRMRGDLEDERQRREATHRDLEREREKGRETKAALARTREEADRSLAQEKQKREALEQEARRRREIVASMVVAVLSVAIVAVVLGLGVVSGTIPIVLVVVSGSLLLGLAIDRGLPRPHGSAVLAWVWGLIGVAGLVLTILATK